MPEEPKTESAVTFNFEQDASTTLGTNKELGLSPAEDTRLSLKRELSEDKKTITTEVVKSAKKGANEIKELVRKGSPLSASNVRENLEIGAKITQTKENLGYEKKEAQLEQIKEMIKSGKGEPIRGVDEPIKGVDEPIFNPDRGSEGEKLEEEGEAPISDKGDGESAYESAYESQALKGVSEAIESALGEGE